MQDAVAFGGQWDGRNFGCGLRARLVRGSHENPFQRGSAIVRGARRSTEPDARRCKQRLYDIAKFMRRALHVISRLLLLTVPLLAQDKRLWVLRAPGEMVEYDPSTFAAKQTVKVPAEAVQAP